MQVEGKGKENIGDGKTFRSAAEAAAYVETFKAEVVPLYDETGRPKSTQDIYKAVASALGEAREVQYETHTDKRGEVLVGHFGNRQGEVSDQEYATTPDDMTKNIREQLSGMGKSADGALFMMGSCNFDAQSAQVMANNLNATVAASSGSSHIGRGYATAAQRGLHTRVEISTPGMLQNHLAIPQAGQK